MLEVVNGEWTAGNEKIDKQYEAAEKQEKEALAKPAKRWDAIVTTVITAVASALAGAFMAVLLH